MGKTIVEKIEDMGYTPKQGRTILVKYFSESLSKQAIDFVWSYYYVLQICEEDILLLPLSNWDSVMKQEVHRSIAFSDIENITVEPHVMNYNIRIETKDDVITLTTQQKELSGVRFSSLIALINEPSWGLKNWHADNLDATLNELRALK